MATRDEVFHKHGPFQTEGLLMILLKQINVLRNEQGLSEWTFQDALNELANEQSHLPPYDWMR